MKELSIEEKAKAYDEALHKAKRIINVCVDDNTECRSMIACIRQIFPELGEEDDRKPNGGIVSEDFNEGDGFYKVNLAYLSKEQVEEIENIVKKWNPEPEESKDEKIRKGIIRNLEYLMNRAEGFVKGELKERIAWLEKQGEPIDINPSEFDLRLNKLLKQFETLSKEELASSLSFYLNVVQNDGTYKADEKQGEQKPADKVESKFKVSDWVVRGDTIAQILDIQEQYYVGLDINGKDFTSSRFLNDAKIHLWSIEDAKDGDVLVTGNKNIFIFKSINDCTVYDYCGLYFGKFIEYPSTVNGSTAVQLPIGYTPATKEQRDALMKAMTDAGYTFDFEKKELKKL